MRGCIYSIEVRHDGEWFNWVNRPTLATARLARRQVKLIPDPFWDKTRIRLRWPRWLIDLLSFES